MTNSNPPKKIKYKCLLFEYSVKYYNKLSTHLMFLNTINYKARNNIILHKDILLLNNVWMKTSLNYFLKKKCP